jgi:hypothetical protein
VSAARTIDGRVRTACYLALAALALIVWSLVDPAPLPVIGAMTVGQLLGTLSLLFFLYAISVDLRPALLRLRALARKSPPMSLRPPPGDETTPKLE